VRLALAALGLLLVAPSLAGGTAAIHVGLVVTGDPSAPMQGAWTATSPVQSGTYHFEIQDDRLSYQVIVPPTAVGSAPQACDIRVTAKVNRMRAGPNGIAIAYSVTSAVATADLSGKCDPVATAYASRLSAGAQDLTLIRGAQGRLLDSTGTIFARALSD